MERVRLGWPGRFANLRRIRSLDPAADFEEIVRLTSREEFPWDYTQGTGIAFMRDYGVPSIAALLDRTREFEDHGVKRYDDTLLIGDEAVIDGIESPRGHAALRRLNRIHGHYDIPEHEFHYVLATTIVGPVRWIEAYGWRSLDPHELTAIALLTTRFGELMGLRGLPTTYDGYLQPPGRLRARALRGQPGRAPGHRGDPPGRPGDGTVAAQALRAAAVGRDDGRTAPPRAGPARAAGVVRPRRAPRAQAPRPAAALGAPAPDAVPAPSHDLPARLPPRGPRPGVDARRAQPRAHEGDDGMSPTRRAMFDDEHEAFRDAVGTFLDKEVVPHHEQWEADGIVDRDAWTKAGAQGLLGLQLDEEYGGGGTDDFRYNAVIGEEMTRRGVYGAAYTLFNDMIVPYLAAAATEEQKQRWFPGLCAGELIAAIAMSEPGAGSDLQGITHDGDATRATTSSSTGRRPSSPTASSPTSSSSSPAPTPTPATRASRCSSSSAAWRASSAAATSTRSASTPRTPPSCSSTDVRVPTANLLGEEGSGFVQLMTNLSQERLSIAVSAATACERVLGLTLDYAKERTAFGRPIGRFQHNRFVIAEMATEAHIARVFVDDCIARHVRGELDTATASMAKWWTTELQKKVVDQGVQMHGGYGYMREYPIARAYVNSRVQTIYGGTTEIQKEIIGRSLGI